MTATGAAVAGEVVPALLRERVIRPGRPGRVAIWGASASGASVYAALPAAQRTSAVVIDSDPRRHGARFADGVLVLPPEAVVDTNPAVVVVATTSPEALAAISERLADLHCTADVVSWLDLMNDAAVATSQVFLGVDRPSENVSAHTMLEVTGWAAAGQGIASIEIRVDGRTVRRGEYGRPRPDVAAMFPRIAGAAHSGFRVHVDVSGLARGPHTMTVRAIGSCGATTAHDIAFTVARRQTLAPTACPACGGPFLRGPCDPRVNDEDLYECGRCGFGTISPVPDDARCREIYNNPETYASIARSREVARTSPVHPDAAYVAHLLHAQHPRGAGREALHVLEVGCANGRLLNGLKRAGFEVAGIEVSEETAAVAREEFGLDVRAGTLGEVPLPRRYDALVLRHVIEHIGEPLRLMEGMHDALADDGVLVLVTPNWQSWAARALGARWEWFIPPLHLHYFTGAALAELGRRSGFELAWITSRCGDARSLALEAREQALGLDHSGEGALARTVRRRGAMGTVLARAIPRLWARSLLGEELVTVFSRRARHPGNAERA